MDRWFQVQHTVVLVLRFSSGCCWQCSCDAPSGFAFIEPLAVNLVNPHLLNFIFIFYTLNFACVLFHLRFVWFLYIKLSH